MTLPKSSGATCSSNTRALRSLRTSRTCTAEGSSTSDFAIYSTSLRMFYPQLFFGLRLRVSLHLLETLHHPYALEQRCNGIGRLCAHFQPVQGLFRVDLDGGWFNQGIVPAEILDNAAIAWRARIGHNDTIAGGFLLPHTF